MNLTPGTRFGPYEIQSQLGAGGMGEVYRAHDPRLARVVALKLIRRSMVHDEAALDRLLREATLASALNHPNIVTIYETGVEGVDRYIAMELIEGATLREVSSSGLPIARVLAIARQIAEALAVAHGASMVHRDIKPENVMVRPDGYVKLLDFGLARLQPDAFGAGHTTAATEAGLILGTIGYMAPEQARGEKVSGEADVFALGVLLYELLTGHHPFMAPSQIGTLHALMWETPEPPSLVDPELPRAIDQLILEMLQKDARLRPGASEVMYRLALVHDSSIARALTDVTVGPRRTIPVRDIVARDSEIEALSREFDRVREGRGRIVFVSGEAGMGKTTLVEAFIKNLEDANEPFRAGRGRCSERLAGTEAYLPVLELLDSLQRSEHHGGLGRLMRAVAPSWYAQIMPPAENDSSAARLATETVGGSQERLKREIAALVAEVGRVQPVVLWLDDVHWADPSTTDLVGYLARRLDDTRALIVLTARPSELAQSRHPFLPLKLDLLARDVATEIAPAPFDEAAIERLLLVQFPGHAFPAALVRLLHQRTDGTPLFVSDLLRDLRRRQVIREDDGRWTIAEDLTSLEREIPESVRSLIQRKLEALDDQDRRLLAAASVQGLDFDSALLSGVLERSEEEVEDALERLEREHALVRFVEEAENRDRSLTLRYRFAHHVYYNALYESLRATRRAALSRSVAETLVRRSGDQPGEGSADIALLFEAARDNIRAADYWNRAAEAAARLYAHDETARLARRGLALLEREPPSAARSATELSLQMTYGLAIKTSQGYAVAEVGRAYARARELSREVEDPALVIPVLIGLSAHHVVSGEVRTAHEIALDMLTLFETLGDPNLRMIAEWSTGAAKFHLGDLTSAHAHLHRSLELYEPSFHSPRVWQTGIEPGIFARCEFARTLTLSGFPAQGLASVRQAVAQARALDHPHPLAFALLFELLLHAANRMPGEVLRSFEELHTVCVQYGIAQELLWARPLRGRALVEMGETAIGIAEMEAGLAAHLATRSTLLRPYYFGLYAGAMLRVGREEDAQRALDDAAAVAASTHQLAYESDRARLQATIHSRAHRDEEAEASFREAVTIATTQGARWLLLRASRAYADFLVNRQRGDEARALLEPLLPSLADGRGMLDYVYADALLRSIS